MLITITCSSHAHHHSERLVQDAIALASAGRTVLIVAHRLSTVRDADQIAVVANGAVEDAGKHEELLTRCDIYRTLVQRQTGGTGGAAHMPKGSNATD